MITLKVLTDGMAARIAEAGQHIVMRDGVYVTSDDAAVQSIIDKYSVADAIAERKAQVDAYAKTLRDKSIEGNSASEIAAWSIKLAEAKSIGKADADTSSLSLEALARGIPLADLVAKVEANAAAFSSLEAQIAGVAGKHKDALSSMGDIDSVVQYDFTNGWPEV